MSRLPDTVDKCGSCEQKAIVCGCVCVTTCFPVFVVFFFSSFWARLSPVRDTSAGFATSVSFRCAVFISRHAEHACPFFAFPAGPRVVPETELLQRRARRRSSCLERSSSLFERWFCAYIFDIVARCAFHFLIVGTFLLPRGVACVSSCLSSCIMINGRNVNKVCVCLCVRCSSTPWLRQLYVFFSSFPLMGHMVIHSPFFCLLLPPSSFSRHSPPPPFLLFVICRVCAIFADQSVFTNACSLFGVCLSFFVFFFFLGCRTDTQWVTQGANYETTKLLSCIEPLWSLIHSLRGAE